MRKCSDGRRMGVGMATGGDGTGVSREHAYDW